MAPGGPSDELEEVEQELSKTDKKRDPDTESADDKGNARKLMNAALWQAYTPKPET